MADLLNITAADAEIVLTVDVLYPQGINLEGFTVDTGLTADEVTFAETRMGVDGKLAVGYVPPPKPVSVALEANSPSQEVFENIYREIETNRRFYTCSLQMVIPSSGKIYTWTDGAVTGGKTSPDIKKTLDPTTWKMTFAKLKYSSI